MYINKVLREFKFELCKVNREVVCNIDSDYVKKITRDVQVPDTIEVEFDKYVHNHGQRWLNPLWYECKEERLVSLNGNEYFVLKKNEFRCNDSKKSFTAHSLEHKLTKVDVLFEDIAIQIFDKDEDNHIYSMNDLLFTDTGWRFGHVDSSILYDIVDGKEVEKLRMQSSVNKRWYDYIVTDMSEMYGCIATFDTLNKKVNLHDIKTFGENIELFLSHDNYIKSLQRIGSTEGLVTRLNLIGSEEISIQSETLTGYAFVEDFSYFYDEMSSDLYRHLMKYYDMLAIREPIWRNLVDEKMNKIELLYTKKTDLYVIYEEINALKAIKGAYDSKEDEINSAITATKITKLIDEQVIHEVTIRNLEDDISNLNNSIIEINILSKRETATDENGNIIFTDDTLSELKEFVYCDTYTNDAFFTAEDLIEEGRRQLSLSSHPKVSYTVDLDNFITRVKSNSFNVNWSGELGIGDIVILFDDDLDQEVKLFVNGYSQYPSSKGDETEFDIMLSNQKVTNSNVRFISDRLKESELNSKMISRKLHLLNDQKYKRINIDKSMIGGTI